MDLTAMLDFLKKLSANNDRGWMAANKKEYEQVRDEFYVLVQALIDHLSLIDRSLVGLGYKDCVYRIHRDIRFSNDKRPYKDYFSAYIMPGGKKSMCTKVGYYFHIQPGGQSIVAGGVHMPPSDVLKKIRREIAACGDELLAIVNAPRFKSVFGEMEGARLKIRPVDYPADHEYIELLKMKEFDAVYYYKDDNLLKDGRAFLDDVVGKFRMLKPLNDFFNEIE